MNTAPTPPVLIDRRILLASNSPRRRQLLSMIVPDFIVPEPIEVDEVYPHDLDASEVPAFLSRLKAAPYKAILANTTDVLITADTVVIVDGSIFGKPHSEDEARAMLATLSGRNHKVVTGVTITDSDQQYTFSETTEVCFYPLSDKEIADYVTIYRPYDKAGAYGIQEYIGAIGIRGVVGCFYNVMGLPVGALYHALKRLYC